MRFKLEQLRVRNDAPGGYSFPNESMSIHKEFVALAKPKRAASISSGGEVPLTVLMPICDEVVAVDHCSTSLTFAMMKAILIEQHDEAALRAFMQRSGNIVRDLLKEAFQEVPDIWAHNSYNKNQGFEACFFNPFFQYNWDSNFAKYYSALPAGTLDIIRERLSTLTFIWGDISDVATKGKFDLFYASNAFEHESRAHNRPPGFNDIESFLPEGAYLLQTGGWSNNIPPAKLGWKSIKHIDYSTSNNTNLYPRVGMFEMGWATQLLQRTTPEA